MTTISDITRGLAILSKYSSDGVSTTVATSYDVIIVHVGQEIDPKLTAEEKLELQDSGWYFAVEFDCWAHLTS